MLLTQIQSILNPINTGALPGWEAHKTMAPPSRRPSPTYEAEKKTAKQSAVLALFYPKNNGEAHIVLTQRPVYAGAHSGQISFPGGQVEPQDVDYQATALREANEEVGIITDDVLVGGQLSELYIPPSNFLVFPFVGFLDYCPVFFPDSKEVVNIIELSVPDLLNDSYLSTESIVANNIFRFTTPCFNFNGTVVWGATAMMLAEIKWLLSRG